MRKNHCDLFICGGGAVGILLALALSKRYTEMPLIGKKAKPPLRIALCEASSQPPTGERPISLYWGSWALLQDLGIAEKLTTNATIVKRLEVSQSGSSGRFTLSSDELSLPMLGSVVSSRALMDTLMETLADYQSSDEVAITIHRPASVDGLTLRQQDTKLTLSSGQNITTELLVIANGARSALVEQLGIRYHQHNYHQTAVCAGLELPYGLMGKARKHFTDHGSIALLPFRASQQTSAAAEQNTAATVAIMPTPVAYEMKEDDGENFRNYLNDKLGMSLNLDHCYHWPLSATYAAEQIRRGIVVMGNAAHTLHPTAAQGLNLAIGDIDKLSQTLIDARAKGICWGDYEVLQHYQKQRVQAQSFASHFSHGLVKLFANQLPPIRLLRNIGLSAADKMPSLKHKLMRHMAELA